MSSNRNSLWYVLVGLLIAALASLMYNLFFTYEQENVPKEKTEKENILMDDWRRFSNVDKYAEANTAVGSPKADETRIVFFGNSITEAWDVIDTVYFKENGYINRGISGQTTAQMLLRFRTDVIDLKPKAVLILAGTNDIAGNTGPTPLEVIANNLFSMAEMAQVNDVKVILCSVLPVYDYPWKPGLEPAQKIISLNQMIKTYAEERGMGYLDYFAATVDERKGMKAELADDGVHPNLAGYKIMKTLAEEALSKALGSTDNQ